MSLCPASVRGLRKGQYSWNKTRISGNVRIASIETEMRQSYLDYAMSVIVQRALPDARMA